MGFSDEETRGPVTVVFLRAEDLHGDCVALASAIVHRKKGEIGEFYPLFVLNPSAEGSAGSDLIYRAWKLGLKLQDDTGWNLRVEFRRGKPEKELEVYAKELQAERVYAMDADDPGTRGGLERIGVTCKKLGLTLQTFTEDGAVAPQGGSKPKDLNPQPSTPVSSSAEGAVKASPSPKTKKKAPAGASKAKKAASKKKAGTKGKGAGKKSESSEDESSQQGRAAS